MISRKTICSLFFFLFLFVESVESSNDKNHDVIKKKDKVDVASTIFNHISDSHEWHILGNRNYGVILYLPIILWNNGLEIFSSYKFSYGNVVKGKYGYYKMFRGIIYKTNSVGSFYINSKGIPKNDKPWDFSITKNVISILISSFLLLYFFIRMKYSYQNHQNKWSLGILLEFLILFVRDEIAIPYIGDKKYKTFLPFLLTSFFFILANNLIGMIPGFPNVTGNINMTLGLALITFIVTNINANVSYWKHIFWMPGVPIGIKLILAPIEFIGIFIRPLTLCIRLFANMTAGHIIILSFICLIFIFNNFLITGFSIIFGFFISMLEIMVSFLQAFIFTTLSALLIGTSVKNYDNETR
ncbi:F0F1 ATP synthase subunit A [Blattabacterium sp. (Blaberus giganteus)]|uniref:F0F1 ATP synthase subunit A n=1 Tax=Blattabacterium sp. (Blaberus giganteus) TaxID=1186051 RepID=UPI00025F6E3E|nr:F0F1 ATP synthase subunit A [Blattabacterium sp. (Blaberus giganteus)]AFJ90528.1 ATP synthase F0 subunit a [Blattabacterium sp. (Blaberus giganteus)]